MHGVDGARPLPWRRRRGSRADASMRRGRSSRLKGSGSEGQARVAAARGRREAAASAARRGGKGGGLTSLTRRLQKSGVGGLKSFQREVLKKASVLQAASADFPNAGAQLATTTSLIHQNTHSCYSERKSRTRHRDRSAGSTEFDPWRPSGRGQACWADTVQ